MRHEGEQGRQVDSSIIRAMLESGSKGTHRRKEVKVRAEMYCLFCCWVSLGFRVLLLSGVIAVLLTHKYMLRRVLR